MSKYKTIRVYPDGDVWVVKKDDATRASLIANTKDEALRSAREIALNQGLVIIIHGKDGRIQKTVRPEDNSSDGSGCFLTSACIQYYGLNDDCYQLQTLRKFRDNYLLQTYEGRALVQQYYFIAPQLVRLIKTDKNQNILFQKIFRKITAACIAIECKKFEKAEAIYKKAVLQLFDYFKA